MKRGCFITAIVVLTIFVAAALYVFQNHFDTLVLNPGKKWLAGFVRQEFEEKLESVKDSPERTELQKIIRDFSENTEAIKKFKEKDIKKLINTIENAMSDSLIQESELEEISQLIKSKVK